MIKCEDEKKNQLDIYDYIINFNAFIPHFSHGEPITIYQQQEILHSSKSVCLTNTANTQAGSNQEL